MKTRIRVTTDLNIKEYYLNAQTENKMANRFSQPWKFFL